jgi:hypothetical protein
VTTYRTSIPAPPWAEMEYYLDSIQAVAGAKVVDDRIQITFYAGSLWTLHERVSELETELGIDIPRPRRVAPKRKG